MPCDSRWFSFLCAQPASYNPIDLTGFMGKEVTRVKTSKTIVFLITLAAAVLAVVSYFIDIPFVSAQKFWFLTGAYVLLALGILLK